MKTVLLDMDGVLVDFVPHWCNYLNLFEGVDIRPDQVTKYALHDCNVVAGVPKEALYRPFQTKGFFRTAPMMPGARAFIKKLQALESEEDFQFFIVSHPAGPDSAKEKLEWLDGTFGPDIKCIFTKHKYMVAGDLLVDDCVEYVKKFLAHQPKARAIIPDTSYLKNEIKRFGVENTPFARHMVFGLAGPDFFDEVLEEVEVMLYR